MKTVDLIPLILLELQNGDKYGFELTKNIETKSEGKVVIKQPTLYTLLKKLEKSKYISSYWQDSEIGGKRHYYRLTDNGKLQASTLPSYNELLNSVSNSEFGDSDSIQEVKAFTYEKQQPLETIIPTADVFSDNHSQGVETELSINMSNLESIKENNDDEKFAENKKVEKFTQKILNTPKQEIKNDNFGIDDKLKSIEEKKFFEISEDKSKVEDFIRYNDYIDFKTNAEYKQKKSVVKRFIFKAFALSLTMLALSFVLFFATKETGRSVMFYVYIAIALSIVIICPIGAIINAKKCQEDIQKLKVSQFKIYLSLTFILLTLISSIIVSVSVGKTSISAIVSFDNLANLYAPLLISLVGVIELLYYKLFISRFLK